MMRWLVFVLCLMAGAASAQQGPVRSGAHAGFTRLTFPLARGVSWQMGRTDNGYGVWVDAPLALDLSQVYVLIDRTRLTGITATREQLSLDVSCNCHATAFLYRDSYLVVDILDGPPPPGSPFEVALDLDNTPAIAPIEARRSPLTPGRLVLPLAPNTPPIPMATVGLRADRPRPPDPSPALLQDRTPALIGLEKAVIGSVARAASQGLLELVPDAITKLGTVALPHDAPSELEEASPPPDATDTMVERVKSGASRTDHMAAQPALGMPGLLAQTSLDAFQADLNGALGPSGNGGGLCWPPQFTDLALPDDAVTDFGTRIGFLRAAVTDDRDRADILAVAALAKGYLSFGFGQEAIQSLAIDGVTDRGRLALQAMAEVVDDRPQTRRDLADQVGCSGSTGLWALLADGTPEAAAKAASDQIVQQFKLLPEPVQTALGPRLANLLRLGGHADIAELALTSAQRMVVPPISVALAETELALHRGDVIAATEILADMAEDNPRITPQALVQLVDLQLSQDVAVTPENMALLESMQFEFRGQPIVADLMRARVAAMAQAGTFDVALTLLPDTEELLTGSKALALRSDVTRAIADRADDMLFLDVAFRPMGRDVAPDVQNAVAARLLDLGFPDRAAVVIDAPAIGGVMAERRYLRAMAAMDVGDPATAAAQLGGVSTPRAQAILGLDNTVGPAAEAAGDETAWRTGDWMTLAASDDTLLQEAAALVQNDVSSILDTQTPLASGRELIEDAARTRVTIDTLMSRFAPPS